LDRVQAWLGVAFSQILELAQEGEFGVAFLWFLLLGLLWCQFYYKLFIIATDGGGQRSWDIGNRQRLSAQPEI